MGFFYSYGAQLHLQHLILTLTIIFTSRQTPNVRDICFTSSMSQSETPATESEDGHINFETTFQGQGAGNPFTVVKDDYGQLVYPGYVPQVTQSPTPPDPITGASGSADSPSTELRPRKAATEPVSNREDQTQDETRPKLGGKSATDAPRRLPARRQSSVMAPPAMRRVGTNVSQLQQALWTRSYEEDDSSTSEESSDEDEDLGASIDRTDQAARTKPKAQAKPASDDQFRRFRVGNQNYKTKGKVSKRDGRLAITIKDISNAGYLPKALGGAIKKVVPLREGEMSEKPAEDKPTTARASSETVLNPESFRCPPLNIVIMVIGSRGDAQPFLKIGKVLKEQYGHRVRIATHPAFREFVEKDSDLEFFSVGGDPSELMAFMVKNPGLIPTLETVRAGDIGRRRAAMAEMFGGFWRACINSTDDEKEVRNLRMMGEKQPFVADLIIANPASFAHVHCAEALGIPLILSFTFPYTPTRSFPHPLASIRKSNVDPGYTNFMSYPLVEMMVWQGLGDLVNDLRVKTLGLDPVSTLWAPGALYRMNVPFAYLWSPSLVPKPPDWGDEIDISGFVFLDLASSFNPPDSLSEFLDAGDTPIYIGFGSIVVDDADKFTDMIFEAVKLAGVRALVSKGWGGLGGDNVPEDIYLLENTPHDWLFPKVKACVIHGGAGTTAIALKCGKPIMVVPFFGDQFFWGSMLANAKAGPEPVPYKHLSAEKLAEGIKYCLTREARQSAEGIARDIAAEGDGAENMCAFVHQHLTLSGKHSMRCSILEDRVAVWHLKDTSLRLSALAADILVEKGYLHWRKLRLIRHCEWNDFEGPGEPVTGVLGSVAGTFGEVFSGIAGVPARLAKTSNKRRKRKEKRRKTLERTEIHTENKPCQDGALSAPQHGPGAVNPAPDGARDPDTASLQTATTEGTQDHSGYMDDVGRGALQSAQAIASAPIDLSVALAQGFHNAPRLYGDDTVRRPPRVTGIRSGLRAARAEFAYGLYDAWTGVVRLPVRGAKQGGGVKGFTKGVGMGLTGLVLKDISAFIGPVGYTLKGLKKQMERRRQPSRLVRRARILQGQREMTELTVEDRKRRSEEVERGWAVLKKLWQTVEKTEKEKGGINAHLGARRRRGVGEALENVDMAERALAAVKRGERVSDAVKDYRKSEELARQSREAGRESTEERRTQDKGIDECNPESAREGGQRRGASTGG